ncbi:MAG: bifunctional folylpolyglutamate synthase/dihydrofolate synthase [Oscillospiraceae bacterium]|nr:bifunctional folylpolyglutamate synthase/dihydrofolate synthase [Oscillospiraceae bacterium]
MDYKEALAYISGVEFFGSKPGLTRIRALLEALGNPQDKLRFVHIAGTNGKGSCAAMTASILKAAGYKTGLYTSPYLYRFNERMQINGRQIDDEVLAEIVTRVKPSAEAMEDHPTEFELMTAAALLWFAQENCDVVVLEVGLGGRFDATNIIAAPEAAVIMNIGLDHTAVLGDTVEQIAFEKAGIIKPGTDVVLFQQSESVTEVIRRRCEEEGARLHIADFSQIVSEFDSVFGQSFTYRGQPYALPLLGAHQLKNAAVVLELAEVLREKGWKLEQTDVEHGLYAVNWPGRFELLSDEPLFVVDGGHNPQCAETVRDNLLHYFPDKRRILLLGILRDKDYAGLTAILDEAADEYLCITPASHRALPAAELAEYLARYGKPVTVCDSIRDGVTEALNRSDEDSVVCAVGSLYSVGEIRACFERY